MKFYLWKGLKSISFLNQSLIDGRACSRVSQGSTRPAGRQELARVLFPRPHGFCYWLPLSVPLIRQPARDHMGFQGWAVTKGGDRGGNRVGSEGMGQLFVNLTAQCAGGTISMQSAQPLSLETLLTCRSTLRYWDVPPPRGEQQCWAEFN